MSAGKFVFGRLSAVTEVTNLVGTRIFPNKAPQNTQTPYIVYETFDGVRHSQMGSDADITEPRVSIHAWSQGYQEGIDIQAEVRIALKRFRGTVAGVVVDDVFSIAGGSDLWDPAVTLYHSIRDFRVIHRE